MAALIINNTPSPASHELGETTLPRSVTARWEVTNEGDEGAFVRAYITYSAFISPAGQSQPWDQHKDFPIGPHEIKWVGPGATTRFTAIFNFPAERIPTRGWEHDPYLQQGQAYVAVIQQLAWTEWRSMWEWPTHYERRGEEETEGWWPAPKNYRKEDDGYWHGDILRIMRPTPGFEDFHYFSMNPVR